MTTEAKHLPAVLTPIADKKELTKVSKDLEAVIKNLMVDKVHYGVIPGTNDKKTLLKPGAELLCEAYGLYPIIKFLTYIENWDRTPELFDYTIELTLKRKGDDSIVAVGVGSCNSYEGRYKWRKAERACPECEAPAIKRSKYPAKGGDFRGQKGWYCYDKVGGCGATFDDPEDTRIVDQVVGKIPNEDIASLKNTVLKMAKKRALVDAVIMATRSSALFTQDVEDFADDWSVDVEVVSQPQEKPAEKKPEAASGAKQAAQKEQRTPAKPATQTSNEQKPTGGPGTKQTVVEGEEPEDAVIVSNGPDDSNQPVGRDQLLQLVEAGKPKGWTVETITEHILKTYNMKIEEMKTDYTWKRWEETLKHVTQSKPE